MSFRALLKQDTLKWVFFNRVIKGIKIEVAPRIIDVLKEKCNKVFLKI
jgi:hypothetical protein